jgi:sugar transferase (PEP-CTERM/EpsH1 system associated)
MSPNFTPKPQDAMRSLLLLWHRIPYPPNKGEKIRGLRILRHLAAQYRVHLGCFIDDPDDWAHPAELEKICAEVKCFDLPRQTSLLRAARGLLSGQALSLAMFKNAEMAAWVRKTVATVAPDFIVAGSSATAQYLVDVDVGRSRVIVDFQDVDSDKWLQYAMEGRPPMSWVYARESRLLLDFDRKLAARTDGSVFVSEIEAALFRRLAPESADKIYGVPNGIDCDYFSPEHTFESPFSGPGPHLVFTGTMDYRPNVDAVAWFVDEILPLIRKQSPEVTFTIVGAKPARSVLKLAETPSVFVTGKVPDVRPYLRHANVVVAPLRLARGIQNKVMEGMAMARPVVTTPQGLEGINAEVGKEILVARSPQEFSDAVHLALQPQSAEVGAAGRSVMAKCYVWESQLAQLDRLLAGPV